jgi:hypothetical protein
MTASPATTGWRARFEENLKYPNQIDARMHRTEAASDWRLFCWIFALKSDKPLIFRALCCTLDRKTVPLRGAPSGCALFYNDPVIFGVARQARCRERRQRTFRITIAVSAFRQRPR